MPAFVPTSTLCVRHADPRVGVALAASARGCAALALTRRPGRRGVPGRCSVPQRFGVVAEHAGSDRGSREWSLVEAAMRCAQAPPATRTPADGYPWLSA